MQWLRCGVIAFLFVALRAGLSGQQVFDCGVPNPGHVCVALGTAVTCPDVQQNDVRFAVQRGSGDQRQQRGNEKEADRNLPRDSTTFAVTPSGIEAGRNVAGSREMTVSSTETGGLERHAAARGCNECNEALDGTREVIRRARRLAMVAASTVMNGDPHQTRNLLEQLQSVLTSEDERSSPESQSRRRPR